MSIFRLLNVTEWVAIAGFFFLLTYSAMQKHSEMQKHITVLTISCILMLVGYIIEVGAECLETAMVGAFVSYLGKPFIMLSSFMLVTTFYGNQVSKPLFAVLFSYCALFSLMVCTNSQHHLYYATASFNADAPYTPLVLTHGPLYVLNIINSAVFFVFSVLAIVLGLRKASSPMKRRLSIYSVLMVLSGMVGYLLYLLNLTNGYDSTVLGVSVGAFFLGVMFFRCRIFDIVDTSKDYALDISLDGLIVFDDANTIVYENKTANDLRQLRLPLSYLNSLQDGETVHQADGNVYSINVNSISYKSEQLGKSVEIHDITTTYNYRLGLEQAVRETTEHLSYIQRTIFASMASIVEARSLETGDHIRRVSEYTRIIAETLQQSGRYADILTDEYIQTLVLSAPMHDIGKISIRDAILLKPGKLDPDEFDEMKLHTVNGEKIIRATMTGLESESYIHMAAEIALYHHERWDGTGYPTGLSGEAIPLSARIVAVADCYDAITSQRCYKGPTPSPEALEILRFESGTHFDPLVVKAFDDSFR